MFPIVNDAGYVMAWCSTRKKAFSRAKVLLRRGSRYAAVPYKSHGMQRVRQYRRPV